MLTRSLPKILVLLALVLPGWSSPRIAEPPVPSCAAPSSALGVPKIDWYRGSFDKAFELAAERNIPIAIFMIEDKEASSEAVYAEVLSDPGLQKLLKRFVAIIGCSDDHPEKKTKHGICCQRFGRVTCSNHQIHKNKAYRRFFDGEKLQLPAFVCCTPNGEKLLSLHDELGLASYTLALKKTLKKSGRGLTEKELVSYRQALTASRHYLKKGSITEALAALAKLPKLPEQAPLAVRAKRQRDEALARAESAVTAAIELHRGGKTLEAMLQLETLSAALGDSDVARGAKKTFDALRKTPKGKRALPAMKRELKLRKRFTEVDRHLERKRLRAAIKLLLRIRKDGKGLPVSARAEERLEAFRGDKKVAEILRSHERSDAAKALLDKARSAQRAKKKEEARTLLERILRDYPKTSSGRRAKKLLDDS